MPPVRPGADTTGSLCINSFHFSFKEPNSVVYNILDIRKSVCINLNYHLFYSTKVPFAKIPLAVFYRT